MIELPEATVLTNQLSESLKGKKIIHVKAAHSPNKFAWYHEGPESYRAKLIDKTITDITAIAHFISIRADNATLLFSEGINFRYVEEESNLPKKHQLLLQFSNGHFLCVSVQMYGGLVCYLDNNYHNPYYQAALDRLSPFSDNFTLDYFTSEIMKKELAKLSLKAFLATEQRFPGLGNGVLQDILYNAKQHPKKKVKDLTSDAIKSIYKSIKSTLKEMVQQGGRDIEKDIFGNPGGYKTRMSRLTLGQACSQCGHRIEKASYMGGSIYFCGQCQKS